MKNKIIKDNYKYYYYYYYFKQQKKLENISEKHERTTIFLSDFTTIKGS